MAQTSQGTEISEPFGVPGSLSELAALCSYCLRNLGIGCSFWFPGPSVMGRRGLTDWHNQGKLRVKGLESVHAHSEALHETQKLLRPAEVVRAEALPLTLSEPIVTWHLCPRPGVPP